LLASLADCTPHFQICGAALGVTYLRPDMSLGTA